MGGDTREQIFGEVPELQQLLLERVQIRHVYAHLTPDLPHRQADSSKHPQQRLRTGSGRLPARLAGIIPFQRRVVLLRAVENEAFGSPLRRSPVPGARAPCPADGTGTRKRPDPPRSNDC